MFFMMAPFEYRLHKENPDGVLIRAVQVNFKVNG